MPAKARSCAFLGLLLAAAALLFAQEAFAGSGCHITEARRPSASVKIKIVGERARTGDLIDVEWDARSAAAAACATPLYLVLSTPLRTRFEGEHLLALPPLQEGPFGIRYRQDRTRVFIPLHLGPQARRGVFSIKVYEAGAMSLDWSLVEVTSSRHEPRLRRDLAFGQETATAAVEVGQGMTIVGGNPAIVVVDRFATDTPSKSIRSRSGEFLLQVFEDYYRVLDAKTEELVLERAGWAPNFSPTSRFLGAYAAGPGYEVIDLYSGTVVTSNDRMHRERSFRGNVHLAAWGPGDAFFALSVKEFGGIEVQPSLVDGTQRSFPNTGCHYCEGMMSALRVDMEAGIVSFQGFESGWASLFDRKLGSAAAAKLAEARYPRQRWEQESVNEPSAEQQTFLDRRAQYAAQISTSMLADLGKSFFFDPVRILANIDEETRLNRPEDNWRFPGAIRVSHLCLRNFEKRCIGRLVDWQESPGDLEARDARLSKFLIEHPAPKAAIAGLSADRTSRAEARLIGIRGDRRRGNGNGDEPGTPTNVLWQRVSQLLAGSGADADLQPISGGERVAVGMDEPLSVAAAMAQTHPETSRRVKRGNGSDLFEPDDGAYYGLKQEAQFIDPRSIKEHVSWRIGSRTYWLIRSFFDNGASSRNWLFLLRGNDDGDATLADLTHRLRLRVGKSPSGLDENGEIQRTEEFATTMGFGGWPLTVDTVSIAFDRYMIATGLWTIDQRRWVLMMDLASDKIVFFNREIPEAAAFHQLFVTQDGGTILQANTNGRLFFYDVATEKLILRGIDIDDELVVYDINGYYAASPEGAQFVFLKFPGIPGYNSFKQFSRRLNRPDLIRSVLVDKAPTPDPVLAAPPKLVLASEIVGGGATRRVKIKASATSSAGLAGLRLFIDGKLAEEFPLSVHAPSKELTLALAPQSRWLSAVAVDASGDESVPIGHELPGAGKVSTSRLFAIVVGTDRYPALPPVCGTDQKSNCDLVAAKIDAGRFAESLTALRGSTYASVAVSAYLDSKDLRRALLPKIRAVVAAASENDTIMFFAAGHGFLDASSGKFLLATPESRMDDLAATSVRWEDLAAAFDGAKARVVVFLDACHSGAASTSGSNDAAVSTFADRRASIAVIAAAKGRQESLEIGGGGVFTTALVRAVTTERHLTDSNKNGAIELAELYGVLKRRVVAETKRAQTPWIARNLMIGEVPLF